ncbi:MAG: tRNA uridine-5-carboxymethylaminomethyl(34) synthesis GTPase MnmE [Candidatus Omnitrophica bacterium CG11_big_fil_rev_8_21_14_0_20_45_26]|uniref:tRNA modification GTPase MnmE n=1 Tax=Candidatus Abzuiibacterium crystallinum TaxID=1974748 RepID=A0A2H0LN14_9BACT|nr:MAG: tRNA uridine-5-carboxymethylaminomethyl(34) synthesis GTPase MnmE [Candidatus Omnitrophica bacterium CG11_big_fil_rev_8_21_14_0_20_45_26]PIW65513.1 MAG: tRNA uridine-5-carboxymethylaminomethyl(34) synthesis GTPase MnmE [Candidatus Omnitrophica bacterium CG12_big_fil_rev_8_21_14_0_65_45_16]
MKPENEETIVAVATPVGEGGIGIVRLSGEKAIAIADQLFRAKKKNFQLKNAESHRFYFGTVIDCRQDAIDEVLAVVFASPHSYTKEDVVELHAHGGLVAVRQVMDHALHLGARMAEPGEFTKRAFLNGRIDLVQAEAVLDTIRAKSDLALKAAVSQLHGSVSKEVHQIKDELMKIYAHMEAYLDFPDEHLEIYSNGEFHNRFDSACQHVKKLLDSFSKGGALREGILTVIIGCPNVGKSSLLNAFLERERALVSDIPGTTRDTLEEMITLEGIAFRLVDTAGLYRSHDPLAKASMARTRQYLEEGDLFIYMVDGQKGIQADDLAILNDLKGKPFVILVNKIDQIEPLAAEVKAGKFSEARSVCSRLVSGFDQINQPGPCCFVSAKSRLGIEELEKVLIKSVWQGKMERESTLVTRLRHKRALEQALDSLVKSRAAFQNQASLELVTFDLKCALDALKEIVGEIYSEDLLDVIFSEFCIGK